MMFPYSKKHEKLLRVFITFTDTTEKKSEIQDQLHNTNKGKPFTVMSEKDW